MAAPVYSEGTRVAGPMQTDLISVGGGTNGAALSISGSGTGAQIAIPNPATHDVTKNGNWAAAGVSVGMLVEGADIRPNTYVDALSTTTMTLSRTPINTSGGTLSNRTMTFHQTAGGGQATTAQMSGVELLAGSNITITPSTTATFGRPAYTLASTASGTGDVSAASNFGTDNVLIKSDGTSKGTQATGISIADTSNNMSGVGTISSGAITATGTSTFATAIEPDADDGATIGSANKNWSDVFLADGAVLNFGDDQDVTLTHVADAGLTLNGALKLHFGDTGTYIHQSADGVLDLVSDAEIEINGATVDINASTEVNVDTPSFIVHSSTSDKPDVLISNTNDDATGPSLEFSLDTANSAANNDVAGTIHFKADDAGNNQTEYGRIQVKANAVTAGSESGKMSFGVATTTSGAYADIMTIAGGADAANSTVTIAGNLTVSGATTQVNTTSITVEDALIELGMVDGSAPSSDTSIDLGMLVNYYSSSAAKKAGFYWDSSTTAWSLSEVVTESSQVLTPTAGATEMRFLYDAGNYYSIGVAANGATTLQTVDSDGAAGNLQITADGTAELAGTTVTLDSAGDITLDAGGADVLFADDGTAYGSISHTATGVMTLKSATDKELEIRSERDMTFVIDDDASDSNSFFSFIAEDNTLADSTNFDGRVGPVTTKYYSTSLLLGQTEFGKGVLSDNAEGTLFTYDGTVFGAAEVVIHISDGTTNQVNKMLICSDTSSGDAIAYSNYSVIYSDGSTELGTVQATISSDTVSVKVDADNNDTVTYAVTFLA